MLNAKWTKDMDDTLREGVLRYGMSEWPKVMAHMQVQSHVLEDVESLECHQRWQIICDLPVKGPWASEEDDVLRALVKQYGNKKWSHVATGLPGRTGKQCRERWLNHLDIRVMKTSWTPEEDELLFDAQRELGNQWSKISRMLPGRAENAVKNRFNSLITKRRGYRTKVNQFTCSYVLPCSV
ncbi:Homeodomain-like protein [Tribonema minus]|uniref:Homeodomain-like protein n=1 Tax=Tribonema minus TaxID=303371 RepID=A0A835Z962_9STRA|nr:Homeodomain-like protein [Tribonema minus]